MQFITVLLVACILSGLCSGSLRAGDEGLCMEAISDIEAAGTIPPGLLSAVALSESGRYSPTHKALLPWPWTVNSKGDGRYFASKAEAIDYVEQLRRSGRRNVDVGCMQINLMHHPAAFASLEEAFTPVRNVAYSAQFLGSLYRETRSWARAIERYHTANAEQGRAYGEKVQARWQEMSRDHLPISGGSEGSRLAVRALPRIFSGPVLTTAMQERGVVSLRPAAGRVAVLRPSSTIGSGLVRPHARS